MSDAAGYYVYPKVLIMTYIIWQQDAKQETNTRDRVSDRDDSITDPDDILIIRRRYSVLDKVKSPQNSGSPS